MADPQKTLNKLLLHRVVELEQAIEDYLEPLEPGDWTAEDASLKKILDKKVDYDR